MTAVLFLKISITKEISDKVEINTIAVNDILSITFSKLSVSILLLTPTENDINKNILNINISQ